MANSILSSHAAGTSNTILVSHGWPSGSSANGVLASHDADYPAAGDTTPDAFSFTDQTDVAVSTTRTSNTITVAGITAAANISITGGTYQIGAGSFVSTSGTVTNGQTVTVRHTSSASNSAATNTVLTIGGVSDTFTSTTVAASGFSAVLNTGTGVMTITGSGFGVKVPAAPYYFNSLESVTNGTAADNAAVGFHVFNQEMNTADDPYVTGVGGHGINGSKAIVMRTRYDPGGLLHKPMLTRLFTPVGQAHSDIDGGETSQFYLSYHLKWVVNTPPAQNTYQLKIFRAAPSTPSNANRTVTNANDYYNNTPSMLLNVYLDDTGDIDPDGNHYELQWGGSTYKPLQSGTYDPERVPPAGTCLNGLQQSFELWLKDNTGTSSNGEFFIRHNGKVMSSWTTTKRADNPTPYGHVIAFVGPDWEDTADVTYYMSRPYIDFTQKRVVLGNAASYNSCTGGFYHLNLSAWSDTSITATDAIHIPSGYDYVFVLDDTGTPIAGASGSYSTT